MRGQTSKTPSAAVAVAAADELVLTYDHELRGSPPVARPADSEASHTQWRCEGSSPGIVEVKGSRNPIVQSGFSPFVTKILADAEIKKNFSKGILVGNGLCEKEPGTRLGDSVFSPHVLEGTKRHSVALVNSVELYWLCCALLRGDSIDKSAAREAIFTGNGYVDLKPFSGQSPF